MSSKNDSAAGMDKPRGSFRLGDCHFVRELTPHKEIFKKGKRIIEFDPIKKTTKVFYKTNCDCSPVFSCGDVR